MRARPVKGRLRGIVLHPQQDELLLTDRLPLFDQDVAFGECVEVLVHQARASLRSLAVISGS